MAEFFEVNLPKTAPYLVSKELEAAYEKAVSSITDRTKRLNEALRLSGMEPNKFHEILAGFFKDNQELFDRKTASELSQLAIMLNDDVPVKLKRREWPEATVLFDTAFTTTKEWESLRHIGIGGSEAAAVMGESPYSTKSRLYHEKVGTKMNGAKEISQFVLDRGHMVESRVVEAFCHVTGAMRIPESRMFASKDFPHSTANIDAIIQMPDGRIYVFEAKTAVEEARGLWTNDKVPRHYQEQCHQYPAIIDPKGEVVLGTYISCMFTVDYQVQDYFISATFDGNKNVSRLIDRNFNQERTILEEEHFFWENYIALGEEPEDEGDPSLELALSIEKVGKADPKQKYIVFQDSDLDLVNDYLDLDQKRKDAEEKAKVLKGQQELIKAKLIEELGDEVEGRIQLSDDTYAEVRFAPTKESAKCDLQALELGFPEAYNMCVKPAGEGYRRFTIKKKTMKKQAA